MSKACVGAAQMFSKARMEKPDDAAGRIFDKNLNPQNRGEAKRAIETAIDDAVVYYSDPERLQELGDTLRYLLPRYGVEPGGGSERSRAECEGRYGKALEDKNEHAVCTKIMVDVYNGAVARMRKAAKKAGSDEPLKIGAGGAEISPLGRIPELDEAYKSAVQRDPRFMWTLETGPDGKTKAVRKNSPTVGDWLKDTGKGIAATQTTDEGLGYLLGSSVRALVRLLPGLREVDGKRDLRSETAKLLRQVEGLGKKEEAVRPHRAGQAQAEAGAGEGLKKPSGPTIFGPDGRPAREASF